jgi:preprotein translocase subunit SecF
MEFIKPGTQFDFMGKRWYFLGLSVTLLILSAISFIYPGPKLGTDFKGGTEIEVAFKRAVNPGDVRAAVERGGFASPDVVQVADASSANHFLIRVQEVSVLTDKEKQLLENRLCMAAENGTARADCPENVRASEVKFSPGGDKVSVRYEVAPDLDGIAKQLSGIEGIEPRAIAAGAARSGCASAFSVCVVSERDHKVEIQLKSKGDQLLDVLQKQLGPDVAPDQPLRVEWIGPKAGAQLRDAALKSIIIAVFFIMAYIAFRFDLRFAPGGIVALVHDVGIALGAMVIARREITLSTVAAMLTIVGYSITDTVIVYDRIRENLGKHRNMSFSAVINLSVSEMFGRTVISSGVTSLSMIMFLSWGTGVIKDFAFALLVGIIVGTYSSIYVAAPFTEWIDKRFFGASAEKRKGLTRQRALKTSKTVV